MKFHEPISHRSGEFAVEIEDVGVKIPLLGIEADVFVEEYIKARRKHRDKILVEDLSEIDYDFEQKRQKDSEK